jgi:hypothetical protein
LLKLRERRGYNNLMLGTSTIATSLVESTKTGFDAVLNLSVDIIAALVIFAVLFLFGLQSGKRRLVALILSFYLALPLFVAFPYTERVIDAAGIEKTGSVAALVYLALAVVIYGLLLGRLTTVEPAMSKARKWLEIGILSAITVPFLFALGFHSIPVSSEYAFSSQVTGIFEPVALFFWWLLLPLVGLFLLARRQL